jgi:hypothetical protein
MRVLKAIPKHLPLIITALMSLALVPLLRMSGLPLNFDWPAFFITYWVSLALQSVFVSSLLYLIAFPVRETLIGSWQRYWNKKARIVVVLFLLAESIWLIGFAKSLLIGLTGLTLVELAARIREGRVSMTRVTSALLVPAAYLFLGFILVFSYNDLIACWRFYKLFDHHFNQLDSLILGGFTVSAVAHAAASHLPHYLFKLLEFIYFGMFPQIGAGMIITGLYAGRDRSLEFVGAILLAYYLALVCYCLWPSLGPFSICLDHDIRFPGDLATTSVQSQLSLNLRQLWEHKTKAQIGLDYFIAFPCMHIAQPMVVMWFLREWRRILWVLLAFNSLLVLSIILLEWHYVVDLLAGVVVAILSIAMVCWPRRNRHGLQGTAMLAGSHTRKDHF